MAKSSVAKLAKKSGQRNTARSLAASASPSFLSIVNLLPVRSDCSTMSTTPPGLGLEIQDLRDERYRLGQCPNCGTQLFKIKKKGLLNKTEVRKPLTTPGLVDRGQCLKCLNNTQTTEDTGNLLAAAAISSVGEGKEETEDEIRPRAAQQQPNNATGGETVYIGDFNDYGERHGPGELLWSNGDKYVGNFYHGLRHGQGTLYFKDGAYSTLYMFGEQLKYIGSVANKFLVNLFESVEHADSTLFYRFFTIRIGIRWIVGE